MPVKDIEFQSVEDVIQQIRDMNVKGGSPFGRAAAWAFRLCCEQEKFPDRESFYARLEDIAQQMITLKPTMATIENVRRLVTLAFDSMPQDARPEEIGEAVRNVCLRIIEHSFAAVDALGRFGSHLIFDGATVMMHSYLVMQDVNHQLFSDSVREEIALGSSRSTEDSLQKIMALLDISELAERHPMTLSGGQKQRVIIASAMFCGKKMLCFDEPTSGLDFSHMMQACDLLKKLQNDDAFLFIITHDYELIASACDSVVHIEHGRVLEQYALDAAGIQRVKSFFTQYMRSAP